VRLRPPALFDAFESLGDNCEFGFVQEAFQSTQLGLFRYASTSIDALVVLFDERFRSLRSFEPSDLRIDIRRSQPDAPAEYIVVIEPFGIEYHAGLLNQEPEMEEFRLKAVRRLALLTRKMTEQIEENEKILVYKSLKGASEIDIRRLARAIRAIGPSTLLWITQESEGGRPGRVERMGDGLLHGCVDRFAPYSDAGNFSPLFWQPTCTRAYRLWRGIWRPRG
jgi:hypothetical protein